MDDLKAASADDGALTTERAEVLVTALFQAFLCRDPDPDALANYSVHLHRGLMTLEDLILELDKSPERVQVAMWPQRPLTPVVAGSERARAIELALTGRADRFAGSQPHTADVPDAVTASEFIVSLFTDEVGIGRLLEMESPRRAIVGAMIGAMLTAPPSTYEAELGEVLARHSDLTALFTALFSAPVARAPSIRDLLFERLELGVNDAALRAGAALVSAADGGLVMTDSARYALSLMLAPQT